MPETTTPDAVLSAMETETRPLPDAVSAAWDIELNPAQATTPYQLAKMLDRFSDEQLEDELQRRSEKRVDEMYEVRLHYGFGRDS